MRALLVVLLLAAPAHADDHLDRVAISDGVAKVKPKIVACDNGNGGTVKVTATVAPSGAITNAAITDTPDKALGECVLAAFKTATFRATAKGGSFSYPFVFPKPAERPAPARPQPETLARVDINDGITKVKAKIVACDKGKAGTVKVKVDVAPSGVVTSATILETPDKALGECVAAEIKIATFRATLKGASFSYPFVFSAAQVEAPPPADPDTLDRAAISDGIAKVKPRIMACATSVKGTVKVKVAVGPSGAVSSVAVISSPDPSLGHCVATAIKQATFKKTASGGAFSYPFLF